jgi:hypothetical protein
MTQANAVDSFGETFLLTFQKKGGTASQYNAIVTTYDITGGEKDFDGMANGAGGRIKKFIPQTPVEVTLEGYAVEVGDGNGFFDLMHTADETQPLSISMDHTRDEWLLAIAHTTSTSATSAVAASTVGDRIIRDIFKNGHFTHVASSDQESIKKFTIKYKVLPFDKNGNSNITHDSSDGSDTAVVPAITYAS